MSDIETSEVLFRLANLEKIIDRVFEIPHSSSTRVILEKKVTEFEETIASYPDSASDLADKARSKVISMWMRLYSKGDNSSQEAPVSSDKVEQSSKANEICPSPHVSTPSESLLRSTSKLRNSFESSFARLNTIESGADVDGIKNLLRETARARRMLARFPKDSRLQFDIFNMAFSKLSMMMRDQYLSIYGSIPNGINLQNLIALLEAEIVAQNNKKVFLVNSMLYLESKKTMRQGESIMGQVFCIYCKSREHVRDACPHIKNLICFSCYRSGHTKRDCYYRRNRF